MNINIWTFKILALKAKTNQEASVFLDIYVDFLYFRLADDVLVNSAKYIRDL